MRHIRFFANMPLLRRIADLRRGVPQWYGYCFLAGSKGGPRVPTPKVLVFSRKPPEEGGISSILSQEGYQVEWTDSGPTAI
jgi:hypothetical protein